jgi:hypothetical protein
MNGGHTATTPAPKHPTIKQVDNTPNTEPEPGPTINHDATTPQLESKGDDLGATTPQHGH